MTGVMSSGDMTQSARPLGNPWAVNVPVEPRSGPPVRLGAGGALWGDVLARGLGAELQKATGCGFRTQPGGKEAGGFSWEGGRDCPLT